MGIAQDEDQQALRLVKVYMTVREDSGRQYVHGKEGIQQHSPGASNGAKHTRV